MDQQHEPRSGAAMSSLPSRGRLLVFAVLLPAAVAVSNQTLLSFARGADVRFWFYPWLVISMATLSWCSGRYLHHPWIGWLIFAWGCALLDILTITACFGRGVSDYFAFALVSAQISLVTLWAILDTSKWQWRLPGALAIAAAVWGFARIFSRQYGWLTSDFFLLLLLTAAAAVVLCAGLRLLGFSLQKTGDKSAGKQNPDALRTYQFGVKHMMIWAAALVPLLVVGRGLDFLVLKSLGQPGTFQIVLLALVVATTNLIAIWAILGSGALVLRVIVLVSVPLVFAYGVNQYVTYLQSVLRSNPRRYLNLAYGLFSPQVGWYAWLSLDAALLAALLLYPRARGYRLMRTRGATK